MLNKARASHTSCSETLTTWPPAPEPLANHDQKPAAGTLSTRDRIWEGPWGSFLFAENRFIPQSGRHTLFPKLSDLIGIECFKPFLAGFSPSRPFHFSCLPNLDPSAKSCPAPAPRPRSVVTMYHSAEKVFLPGMSPDTHNTHLQSPPPKLQGLLRNLQPHQSTFL